MKKILSVGFNGVLDDLIRITNCSPNVKSIYTGGDKSIIAGGRSQYNSSLKDLSVCALEAHKRGIEFEVALNAPCGIPNYSDKIWWDRLKNYLIELETIGVTGIIASHPFVINTVKTYTNMKVTASTICEINSGRMALYYEKMGADTIVPSMNINYNFQKLTEIHESIKHAKIKIMVNEHCLGDCPWRKFHHNNYAHSDLEIDYHIKCKKLFMNHPELFLTNSAIRPEDIHKYKNITNEFKIVGRLVPINILIKRIIAYDNERWDGNFVELFDYQMSQNINIQNSLLNGLFDNKSICGQVCYKCNRCKELYLSIKQQ